MERKPEYRLNVEVGDLVRLPSGELGVVADLDVLCGGHALEVTLFPFVGFFRRLWLSLTCRIRYYDNEVNSLTLITRLASAR